MSAAESLSQKTLVMMVGPSAAGKSTVMNEMVRIHDDFAYVKAFTTRSPRPNEKTHYTFIDKEEALQLQETGQAVTYIEHPTTHDIYGTTIGSYPGQYNLLDTLSGSVALYRALPFEKTVTIALTAPSDQWQKWFLDRYPEPSEEAQKRLGEAVLSIKWALNDPETHWIINREGALQAVAEAAIATVLSPALNHSIPDESHALLERISQGIW
jgi:guanylate kinase